MIAPIAIAGMSLLPSVGTADVWVVSLPLHMGNNQLAVIALLGGMSAATGMVIVACVIYVVAVVMIIVKIRTNGATQDNAVDES